MTTNELRAYEVRCSEFPEHDGFPGLVNALSAGEAKARRWRSISDAWPGVPFTSMRARVAGRPHSGEQFQHCCRLRGRVGVRCGDRVSFGESSGLIVGANASANWDVLVGTGKWSGQVVNVHPDGCEYAPATATEREERDRRD